MPDYTPSPLLGLLLAVILAGAIALSFIIAPAMPHVGF